MNRYQRRLYREQSKKAAAGYVTPADCIGKEFTFSAFIYRVVQYHPRKGKFTCERVNAFDQRVELDETFVRHHCTPVDATLPQPGPRHDANGQPRYSLFPPVIISDKTEDPLAQKTAVVNCEVDYNMTQPELVIVQSNTTLEVEPCSDVTIETASASRDVNQVPATTPLPTNEVQWGGAGGGDINPAYYLDQKFQWATIDGAPRTCTVQAFNERRQQFRLYEPNSGYWYREPEFVYEHCQPAAQPVSREPLPKIEFDPYRFWNLVSVSQKREIIAADVQATGVPQADPLRTCGCCGQHLTIIGKQVYPPQLNRKDDLLVECCNSDCVVYKRTSTSETHHEICEAAQKEQTS